MTMRPSTQRRTPALWILAALFAAILSCTAETPGQSSSSATEPAAVQYLDQSQPELTRRIATGKTSTDAKFVEIEVAEVTNPRKYGLAFDVYFQSQRGDRVRLGSFSLFPADNPGRFIVPTQNKIQEDGSIVVSMKIIDPVSEGDSPRVGIRDIQMRAR
jgi:hypothetical protein